MSYCTAHMAYTVDEDDFCEDYDPDYPLSECNFEDDEREGEEDE